MEAVGRAGLERAQEHLLAGLAVEVVVGVAVARERERVGALQPLVAGLDVDRREARRRRHAGRVVVVLVDVHVDAAERVDEPLETGEVDVDQIVGPQAGDALDRLQRGVVAAGRVGRVDLRPQTRHPQVAWDREQRDDVVLRVEAGQHQGVGEAVLARRPVRAVIRADHQRRDRLGRRRDLRGQVLRRLLVAAVELGDLVVDVVQVPQLVAARGQHDEDEQSERHQDIACPAGQAVASAAPPAGRFLRWPTSVDHHLCAPGRISLARFSGRRRGCQAAPRSQRPAARGDVGGARVGGVYGTGPPPSLESG